MNWVQTIAKNMAALATGQAAYRLGLVALEIVRARTRPPAQFGEFAAALGFANMFLVFMDLGVALGLVRVVSRHDPIAPAYFGGSLLLRGAVAAVLFPVMLGLSVWLHPPSRVPVVAILGICGVLDAPEHPGFAEHFVPDSERTLPARHFEDLAYPACWWSGDVGLYWLQLREQFGHVL